jgi:hypothetical protein
MSLYGFTEFGNETRDKFRDTIFERMDTVFSNWLYGEYDDCELDYIIENDLEVRSMCSIYESLWATFRVGINYVDKFDWLESRGMSHFPTRASRVVSIDNRTIPRLAPIALFQRARTFSMHGPSGEVEHVVEPMTERAPRRSTRAKKQREFYYGF